MARLMERYVWLFVFALLPLLTIPWFFWGVDTVRFGLPIWIWWYIGWMGVTAIVFYAFTRYAWGLWVTGVDHE